MNIDNINLLKLEIEEYKNMMLESYKNLVVAYESSRQLYEKIIAEYEAGDDTDSEIVPCVKISAKNHSVTVTKWALITLAGKTLYTSHEFLVGQTCVIDLSKLNIIPGTKFVLKSLVVAGKDSVSDVVLEYAIASNGTALFELKGTPINTDLNYLGTTYPVLLPS